MICLIHSVQEDKALVAEAGKRAKAAKVVNIKPLQSSLDLWEPICLKGNPESDEPLLLLPEGYSFIGEESPLEEIGMVGFFNYSSGGSFVWSSDRAL